MSRTPSRALDSELERKALLERLERELYPSVAELVLELHGRPSGLVRELYAPKGVIR